MDDLCYNYNWVEEMKKIPVLKEMTKKANAINSFMMSDRIDDGLRLFQIFVNDNKKKTIARIFFHSAYGRNVINDFRNSDFKKEEEKGIINYCTLGLPGWYR